MKALFVIPSYFSGKYLTGLLETLRAQTVEWEAIIVDNSCDANEAEALRQRYSFQNQVVVAVSKTNVGYYNSLAVAASLKPFEAYNQIWLLNPDVRLTLGALAKALESSMPEAGVIAPSIISGKGGHDQNPFLRTRPGLRWWTRLRFIFRVPIVGKLWVWGSTHKPHARRSAPVADGIYAPHGACIIFLRKYFMCGGPVERPEWLFLEELTIAEEARARGLAITYRPEIEVHHVGQSSTGTWRSSKLIRAQREAIESVRARYAPW